MSLATRSTVMNSDVTYPSLSGTAVARDYVEFPSNYWSTGSHAKYCNASRFHFQTGKPIPPVLLKESTGRDLQRRLHKVEYLSAALVDMKLHLAATRRSIPMLFEKPHWPSWACRKNRDAHRTPQFLHGVLQRRICGGLLQLSMSDVLTADAYGALSKPAARMPQVAERLRKYIFFWSATRIDPADAYRSFRGRDPRIEALMKKRGFPMAEAKPSSGQ